MGSARRRSGNPRGRLARRTQDVQTEATVFDGFAGAFAWTGSAEGWIALGTLTVLEIVLGIDNIVFI